MAKLPEAAIKSAQNAEDSDGDFPLMPAGIYHGRLTDVDASKSGPKGRYFVFQYDIVTPGYDKRKLWDTVSLSDGAAFKRKQVWDALGYPLDTDTEDMIGTVVKIHVKRRVIQSGAREGEMAEQVDRVAVADEEFAAMSGGAGATGKQAVAQDDVF